MRVLVLSSRLTDRRRAAFQALAQEPAALSFVRHEELSASLSEHDAVVVDGRPPAQPIETLGALRAAVERGVPLVAIGAQAANYYRVRNLEEAALQTATVQDSSGSAASESIP